ncbi:ORF-89 [Buzura suppressaria nucleopolyhedrovirus]|uniref:ORF-89 n=1 Tax=Buzura suppressaria nuclear polyhedrosis virus TaxID=74320 RepID=W5VKT2_NPVBS|nr:ORF-89 [Buzura suppressaria nucleopolyhedrovirus]AHH82678.1 ORF-89 [Buzura suppressaria nucleopolyhedrovirus]AKN91062.1 ORF-92 [Buzura suppressaria nucleopolyhedrovirus]
MWQNNNVNVKISNNIIEKSDKGDFTHSALRFACTFLASRCYDTSRFEEILNTEPNGHCCLELIEAHLPRHLFNAIVVHLKRIVWKFVKCMYIKNDRLRSMCLDRRRDCDDFVASNGGAFTNDNRLSRYLKILYQKYYLHEMTDDIVDFIELKNIMNNLNCILTQM